MNIQLNNSYLLMQNQYKNLIQFLPIRMTAETDITRETENNVNNYFQQI